jgi:hypothetical protein
MHLKQFCWINCGQSEFFEEKKQQSKTPARVPLDLVIHLKHLKQSLVSFIRCKYLDPIIY